MDAESDDEPLVLSSHALDALKEFYADRDVHAKKFEKLKEEAEENAAAGQPLSMEAFSEDWNESQFWYSEETAAFLAEQLLNGATEETAIVIVSAPSVFVSLKNMLSRLDPSTPRPQLCLLEHDPRFSVFKEFVFYDFQQPMRLPVDLKGKFNRIICDPPFLSEDCQTKAALTVRWLSATNPQLIVCTGERMESLVTKLYKSFGLKTTTYEPIHSKGLSNEFCCYANFKARDWDWKDTASGPTS